jgi:hypothetical protein
MADTISRRPSDVQAQKRTRYTTTGPFASCPSTRLPSGFLPFKPQTEALSHACGHDTEYLNPPPLAIGHDADAERLHLAIDSDAK